MDNRMSLKLRLSKMLSTSFASCKTQNISHAIDHHQNPILYSPQHHPFPNNSCSSNQPLTTYPKQNQAPENHPPMCMPTCPHTFDAMIRRSCFHPKNYRHYSSPRRKITIPGRLIAPRHIINVGRRVPTLPPSPLLNYLNMQSAEAERILSMSKKKTTRKNSKGNMRHSKKKTTRSGKADAFQFPLVSSSNDEDWFSSDDEREDGDPKETLLSSFSSSKSLSFSFKSQLSISSEDPDSKLPPVRIPERRMISPGVRHDEWLLPSVEEDDRHVIGGSSIAVVKMSSGDPCTEFRTSMVEMIIERQMFGTRELEKLLECFLFLNSPHHHKAIVEVFAEILETLFPH